MQILSRPIETQAFARQLKEQGPLVLVPTMGCLHDGHLALVKHAKDIGKSVAVSIFVNPKQFGPNEDFDKYPRTFESDCEKLKALGVDLVFHPEVNDLYPDGYSTDVSESHLSQYLCGASRPGHFAGVTTVCLKLFQATLADAAVFGEKDFQQVRVLEKMVEDLNLTIAIVRHPIVRETDGLAMSSRNLYLSSEQREAALTISKSLFSWRDRAVADPSIETMSIESDVTQALTAVGGQVDYVHVVSEADLKPSDFGRPLSALASPRLAVAVRMGDTRLIDNIALY